VLLKSKYLSEIKTAFYSPKMRVRRFEVSIGLDQVPLISFTVITLDLIALYCKLQEKIEECQERKTNKKIPCPPASKDI